MEIYGRDGRDGKRTWKKGRDVLNEHIKYQSMKFLKVDGFGGRTMDSTEQINAAERSRCQQKNRTNSFQGHLISWMAASFIPS